MSEDDQYRVEYEKLVAGIQAVFTAEAEHEQAKTHYTRTVDHANRKIEAQHRQLASVKEEASLWKDDALDALSEAAEKLAAAKQALRLLAMNSQLAEELQKKIGEALADG